MRNRRGFSLVELLAVFVAMAAIMIVTSGLFVTVISDIPRSYRVVQANTSMLDMLETLRNDIAAAKGLPETFGQYKSGKKSLLIELSNGIYCYELNDDEIIRRRLDEAVSGSYYEDKAVWPVTHGMIDWRVVRKDGHPYAVEVQARIEYKVRGNIQKKFANSHLFFVGAFREASREI
jgi:type II secretory pathway component PulJ